MHRCIFSKTDIQVPVLTEVFSVTRCIERLTLVVPLYTLFFCGAKVTHDFYLFSITITSEGSWPQELLKNLRGHPEKQNISIILTEGSCELF